MAKKELAKKDETKKEISLVDQEANESYGRENVNKEDLIIPRLKLAHPNNKATLTHKLTPGAFYNNLTIEQIGEEVVILPIIFTKTYVKFDKDFNLIWRTTDPTPEQYQECQFPVDSNGDAILDKDGNAEKPPAQECMEFLCMVDGDPMPLILTFSKTSYKEGKKLLSLATMFRGALFSRKYKISSEMVDCDSPYFKLKVMPVPDGKAENSEYLLAKEMYDQFSNKDIKVHEDTAIVTEEHPDGGFADALDGVGDGIV